MGVIMKKTLKIVPLILIVSILMVNNVSAKKYDRYLQNATEMARLTRRAKGRASDVIAIAATQKGYKGYAGKKRYSYFGDIWNPGKSANYKGMKKNNSGDWCSEFVWWCLVRAKVLNGSENINGVKSFREFYKDRMYKMYSSAYGCKKKYHKKSQSDIVKDWFKGYESKGTLKLKDLRKGDIVQICKDNKKVTKPHHTALVYGITRTSVLVWEGNVGKNNKHTYVKKGKYKAHEIIAVLRPKYNKG